MDIHRWLQYQKEKKHETFHFLSCCTSGMHKVGKNTHNVTVCNATVHNWKVGLSQFCFSSSSVRQMKCFEI